MKNRSRLAQVCVQILCVAVPVIVYAGPDWEETINGGGDAGSLIESAQPLVGFGAVHTIVGSLDKPAGDFQDMFLIRIEIPTKFVAITELLHGGSFTFNTQLWLFDAKGTGILANDDVNANDTASYIDVASSEDAGVLEPGFYYLAISGFNSDPLSAAGPIFDQSSSMELTGPDGVGGKDPLNAWTLQGETGVYVIQLTGAQFAFCPTDFDQDGVIGSDDFAMLLSDWGTCLGCASDLNGDGRVNGSDLGMFLGSWGSTCY